MSTPWPRSSSPARRRRQRRSNVKLSFPETPDERSFSRAPCESRGRPAAIRPRSPIVPDLERTPAGPGDRGGSDRGSGERQGGYAVIAWRDASLAASTAPAASATYRFQSSFKIVPMPRFLVISELLLLPNRSTKNVSSASLLPSPL